MCEKQLKDRVEMKQIYSLFGSLIAERIIMNFVAYSKNH